MVRLASAAAFASLVLSTSLALAGSPLFGSPPDAATIETVAPGPGRDKVPIMKPDWCGSYQSQLNGQDQMNYAMRRLDRSFHEGFTEKFLVELARAACDAPNDPYTQKQIAMVRQTYLNRVGTTEKQDREAQKARLADAWAKQKEDHCDAVKPSDEGSEDQKAYGALIQTGTGCNGTALEIVGDRGMSDAGLIDDRNEPPSELARAVHVIQCLRRTAQGSDEIDLKSEFLVTSYPGCGVDARRLDAKKLEVELEKSGWNDYGKINARETHGLARIVATQLEEHFKKLAKKDPRYQKLLFDAPEAGFAAWEKSYTAQKALFDQAIEIESKAQTTSSKKMGSLVNAAQCTAFRKGYRDYLVTTKPANSREALIAMTDSVGKKLLTMVTFCDAAEEKWLPLQYDLEQIWNEAPREFGGPRQAAFQSAMEALGGILEESERFPVRPENVHWKNDTRRSALIKWAYDRHGSKQIGILDTASNAGAHGDPANPSTTNVKGVAGQVASVTKQPDGVLIKFAKIEFDEEYLICKDTNKVESVRFSGSNATVNYQRICKDGGKQHVVYNPPPILIPAPEFADGIKVGMFMNFDVLNANDFLENIGMKKKPLPPTRVGWPREVYQDKFKKVIGAYLGYALRK